MAVAHRASAASLNGLTPIESLDFPMIRMKLMDLEEGRGWTAHHARRVEEEYRRYLALTMLHGAKSVVPSQEVDAFLALPHSRHASLCRRTATRCSAVFSITFHTSGCGERRMPRLWSQAYDETLSLYEAEFGLAPEDLWPREGMSRCPKCGRR